MEYVPDPDWPSQLETRKRRWFEDLVLDIGVDAEAIAPVDTGALKQSIRVDVNGDVGIIGSDLDYSVYVEEGHRIAYRGSDGVVHYTGGVVPPQPYLKPALFRQR